MRLMNVEIGGALNLPMDEGISADGYVYDLYTAAAGAAGLIDTDNSSAVYNATEDSYGAGVLRILTGGYGASYLNADIHRLELRLKGLLLLAQSIELQPEVLLHVIAGLHGRGLLEVLSPLDQFG